MDGPLITLLTLIALDIFSFFTVTITEKNLTPGLCARVLVKKIYILLIIGVGNIIDVCLIGDAKNIRGAVTLYFISNEGVTILEGAARIGLPVPEKLKYILEQLHKK